MELQILVAVAVVVVSHLVQQKAALAVLELLL
jgi:hypothetical protein